MIKMSYFNWTLLASAFDYLDHPLERVTELDIPLPYAPNLEAMCLPQVENIVSAVKKVLRGAKI